MRESKPTNGEKAILFGLFAFGLFARNSGERNTTADEPLAPTTQLSFDDEDEADDDEDDDDVVAVGTGGGGGASSTVLRNSKVLIDLRVEHGMGVILSSEVVGKLGNLSITPAVGGASSLSGLG